MSEYYLCLARFFLGKMGLYLLLVIIPGSLIAAEWTITPSLGVRQSYNDNIRLTTLTHPNVSTTTTKPKIDFGWATERENINLIGEWTHNQYAGDPNLENRTDRKYELKSAYKTERSQFSLDASYKDDTTLAQEDYNEDIGATLAQLDRQTNQLMPTWSWMVTERANLRFELQYQDATYAKAEISPYNDYRYDSAGITYSFQWTARDQIYVLLNQSRYDSKKRAFIPDNEMVSSGRYLGSDSDTLMFQFGLNHQFSTSFKMGAGYGSRESKTQTQYQTCLFFPLFGCLAASSEIQTENKSKSPVYTLSADKDFELGKLGIKLSRTISASGLGSEMEIDTLDVNIEHRLTEKLRLKIKFLANQRAAVNPDFSYNDRNFLRGEVNLGWGWDRHWNLYAKYRYTRQSYDRSDAIATSNLISLNIRYTWDKFSKSW